MVGIVCIITGPIRIPVATPIAYTPTYRIPSAIIIGTIPGIPIPGVPMPWVVDIGYAVPIPWVIEMTTMETCQTKTIVEIHVVAIGKSLVVTLAISQIIETLCREFVGLSLTCVGNLHHFFGKECVGRYGRITFATSVVFVHIAHVGCRSSCHNTGCRGLFRLIRFVHNLYHTGGLF